MKSLHALALCVVLAGCSTVPMDFSEATPPSDRNVHEAAAMLPPGSQADASDAVLMVSRDKGIELAGCGFDFFLDDALIATLSAGDGFRMRLAPGKHRARIEMGGIICQLYQASVDLNVSAGTSATVRMGIMDTRPYIRVVRKS